MADNVTFTSTNPAGPPNATVQRTDDLGAAGHVPYAKLMDGTDNSSTVIAAGGGVESGALRVTLASDSTGLVSVDDNGSTLTVDAPVGTPVFVRLSDGSSAIATLPVSAASLPLPSGAATAAKQPALGTAGSSSTDVLSVQGIASGTALPVSAASLPLPSGASTLAEQQTQTTALQLIDDSISTTGSAVPAKGVLATGTDGTNARALKTDSSGELQVDVLSSALPSGASTLAEQQTQTTHQSGAATSLAIIDDWDESDRCKVNVISGQVGIAGGTGTDGATVPRVTLATNVALPAGTNNIGDVDVLTVPADPFGANADAASATGSISAKLRFIAATGIPITGTVTVGSHAVTNAGTFVVQENGAALTALQIMDDWDNGASDGASVSGDVAHDTADAGEPVKQGAKATTALSGLTLVANNDRTDLFAGIDGVQIVRPYCNLEDIVTGVAAITDGSSTTVISAQAAGIKVYVTSVIIANSSGSNVTVDLRDGAAGSVKATLPAPTAGGVVTNFPVPLGFSAATAVCADPSAAASTVTVTLIGFKSKV